MRHLEVRHSWLQAEASGQRIVLRRAVGDANPTDLLTKYCSSKEEMPHFVSMSVVWIGRNPKYVSAGHCNV
jgi:hypothetical protein